MRLETMTSGRRRLRRLLLAALLMIPATAIRTAPAQAATVPAGFVDTLVTAGAFLPTSMAFTPDGRMLITTKPGVLYVYDDDELTEAMNLSGLVCDQGERGMVGVAPDPDFAVNRAIYVYYTSSRDGRCPMFNQATPPPPSEFPFNVVSRFTLADDNTVDPGTEAVILGNIPSFGIHNAGDLHFGPVDKKLYISSGDAGCRVDDLTVCQNGNDNARRNDLLLGKILRINRDGTIPADNPFAGERRCGNPAGATGTGRCAEIFATGLRNPFRFAFQPGSDNFYINDVGGALWEEIDEGRKGADYGWNLREGACARHSRTDCGAVAGLTNPVYAYDHNTGCTSVTGGAFVPSGVWPAPYSGSYLFADFVCGTVFRLAPRSGGGFTQVPFVQGLGENSLITMTFGPYENTQALYYATFEGGGQIRRVTFGTELPPTAAFTASPGSAPQAPLTVTLNASGSIDPDGDRLRYHWSFGDGTTAVLGVPSTTHTFTREGGFRVTLRVEDDARLSAPVDRLIEVGDPPTATILGPSTTARFAVGQTVTLSGRGSDPDETLDGSDLSWTVMRHHNGTHTHPFLTGQGATLTFTYPQPEDLDTAGNSHLEVTLTATDSTGLRRSMSRDLLPKKVSITVQDNRSTALRLKANDISFSGHRTFTSWQGYGIRLHAESPQQFTGRYYKFRSWSDGGAQTHDITTPSSSTTYTANFDRFDGTAPTPAPAPPPPAPTGVQGIARTPAGFGYWLASDAGKVQAFGNAPHRGDTSTVPLNRPVVGITPTPSGQGYWLVASDGGVFSFGDARFFGSTGGMRLNQPVVGIAATPTGQGYWLVASDGGVFSFGDARFWGSTGGVTLNKPVVGMDATPTGAGYWLVAADGGIFAFGDAPFRGSTGGQRLNRPVVGLDSTPTGDGYWLMASDGGVFAFTDAIYHGGTGASPPGASGVGIAATPDGQGYWLAFLDSTVAHFGNAPAF